MWGWLQKLIGRDDRGLFHYHDGVKNRSIDPVAGYRLLWITGDCDLLRDSAMARNPTKEDGTAFYPIEEVYDAEDRLRSMAREIFGVKEWKEDQAGLTVDETDELLNRFITFCNELKKKRNQSRTPSQPTESMAQPSSLDTPAPAVPPFPDGVDSGSYCTTSESSAGAPTGR